MAAQHPPLRIAAVGDIHCDATSCENVGETFARMAEAADLILLAGDLTTYGEPEQARLVADAARDLQVPVLAVLGNHDLHANRGRELVDALTAGGIQVLEGEHVTLEAAGRTVGIVGAKGFIGGFPGSYLPDFGEPLLRKVYAETSLAVHAIDEGLRAVAGADVRIVLLHYSPSAATIEGEPPGILAFLGSDRLALPIAEHRPDLVLHGHAHAGRFLGHIGEVPVYNVSVPVLGRDYWLFEVGGEPGASLHGEGHPGEVAGRT
jgi:Icc-related predicted phosphoesterase